MGNEQIGGGMAPSVGPGDGRRFSIEATFRDTKDTQCGMGLKAYHIKSPGRRDRLLLLAAHAYAHALLIAWDDVKSGLVRVRRRGVSR